MKKLNLTLIVLLALSPFLMGTFPTKSPALDTTYEVVDSISTELFTPVDSVPKEKEPNYYIKNMAAYLKVDYTDLFKLIAFETGHTFSASVKNPYSGAVGVIQFTNSTARTIKGRDGKKLKDADDLLSEYSTFGQQMELPNRLNQYGGPVYQYLSKFGQLNGRRELYLAVFYPVAINMADNTPLPEHITAINPGIITVGDYCASIDKRVILSTRNEYD